MYIVKITQVCKLGLEKPLFEMARVGFFDEYEIYIHTDDPGKIPHFHLWDAGTKGNKFHTCIRIDKSEYFHHTGKEDVLNTNDKKDLCKFLSDKPKNKRYETYWEYLVSMWNDNNSDVEIPEDQSMPDYTKLPNKK